MSDKSRVLRRYVWSFVLIFLIAEVLLIGVDLFYLLVKGESPASFLADVAVTSVILLLMALLAYFILAGTVAGHLESERRFRELADHLPEGVFEIDTGGRIIYANSLAMEWFGYSREEVEAGGLSAMQMVVAEERGAAMENFGRVLGGELEGARSYRALRKDGTAFPVLIASSRIMDREGAVAGLRGVMTDITVQKRVEEMIRESERKYRELADSLPQIVFEMDTGGNMLYANANAFDVFGYDEDAIARGVNVREVIAGPASAEADIRMMVEHEVPEVNREYVARRKDGGTFPCVISARLVFKEGKPVGIRGIMTDITEQKRREQEYQRVNAELRGYAHTVSHDLKNPLHEVTVAAYTLEMLASGPATAEAGRDMGECLEAIKSGLQRANRLIEDLLMLAESGQVPRQVVPVDIARKVEEILAERSDDLSERGVEVKRDDDLGSIIASPTHIYQVFSNLIKNAIVYNDNDRPILEIRAVGGEEGEHRFMVRDNGGGIPPEIIDEIFVPFTRGRAGDTGIGLSIVENIARVYGGEVRAFNDGGACFEVLLFDYPDQT